MSATMPGRPAGGCVAITGATGMLGRHLCDHFRAAGWQVRGLDRILGVYPYHEPGIELFPCDLPDHIDPAGFAGASVLIHCAYMTRHTTVAEARRVNEDGTARLYELWRSRGGGKFVFISTTSAHEGARSYYGQSKLRIEQRLDPARDLVIRPGLILAAEGEGLFHRLRDSLRRTQSAPVFDGGKQIIQTVYIGDLCAAIYKAVVEDRSGRFVVAEPEGRSMRDFLRLLADRCGVRCRIVSLPSAPLLVALRLLESLRIPLPVSSENVLGAQSLVFQSSAADLRALGVEARGVEESLKIVLPSPGRGGSAPWHGAA
jgi:nucleoside-diphosphate-sugar epimerase